MTFEAGIAAPLTVPNDVSDARFRHTAGMKLAQSHTMVLEVLVTRHVTVAVVIDIGYQSA